MTASNAEREKIAASSGPPLSRLSGRPPDDDDRH